MALLSACQQTPKSSSTPPLTLPSYGEVAERYNANVATLDRLWARASVKLFFRDERGKWKTETGEDSLLMFERPHGVALSLGKLGKTAMWAGCNQDQYWLFDLIDSRTVWHGRTENLGQVTTEDFPLPVHPQRLIALPGATPIPADVATDAREVRWEDGAWVIDAPAEGLRLWLDPGTGMPRQIVMFDDHGHPAIWSKLTGEMRVRQDGLPKEQWPRIRDRAEITIKGVEGTLTMWLKDGTDARNQARQEAALNRAFDFAWLVHALKPQQAVDLDRDAPQPTGNGGEAAH